MSAATSTNAVEVKRSMLVARDEKIERIVAMVDNLPARGEADALIAPLRTRLMRLRPRRKLTSGRLMFMPLDPLIVPTAEWQRGQVGLPRGALTALIQQCRERVGDALEPVEQMIEGTDVEDAETVRRAGALLWPLAARAFEGAPPPAGWAAATGLSAEDHAELLRLILGVLREAPEIEALVARTAEGSPPEMKQLRPLLARAAAHGEKQGVAAVLAVLLARLPVAERVLNAAGELAATGTGLTAAAADLAIDIMLENVRPDHVASRSLGNAADELDAVAALLNGVERTGAGHRPSRRARSAELRRALQSACRERFSEDLRARVLTRLAAGVEPCDAAAQAEVENAARDLRRFEHASRQLGGEPFERMLWEAADLLKAGAGPMVDRLRVIEILLGSDYARTMLSRLE